MKSEISLSQVTLIPHLFSTVASLLGTMSAPYDNCRFVHLPLSYPENVNAMAQTVKNLPAMQETWVLSPGGKDPLE